MASKILFLVFLAIETVAGIDIKIRSEGCFDPGNIKNSCGISTIKVDWVDWSPHGHGMNFVVIDWKTGKHVASRSFDWSRNSSTCHETLSFIENLPDEVIVLVAAQGDANGKATSDCYIALKKIGGRAPLQLDKESSFAMIGYKGKQNLPEWVDQRSSGHGRGPTTFNVWIDLCKAALDIQVYSEGAKNVGKHRPYGMASIIVNDKELSLNKRGMNFVVIDLKEGRHIASQRFDWYVSGNCKTTAAFIGALQNEVVVIAAVMGEATQGATHECFQALNMIGGIAPYNIQYGSAFALLGYKGTKKRPSWVKQVATKKGPISFRKEIEIFKAPLEYSDIEIKVHSESCRGPAIIKGSCGYSSIFVNGKDYSRHGRGMNFVVVDWATGNVITSNVFDWYADKTSCSKTLSFVNSLQDDVIVITAVQEDASGSITPDCLFALRKLGGRTPFRLSYRSSFALIGYKGKRKRPDWVEQRWSANARGPTKFNVGIEFLKS